MVKPYAASEFAQNSSANLFILKIAVERQRNEEAKLKPLGAGPVLEILHLAGEMIKIHNFASILGLLDSS